MLHYDSYPHIFDLIFDYAFPASHLTLRHVNREWREKVLARCYHLQPRVAMDDGLVGFNGDLWEESAVVPIRRAEHVLRYCRILDSVDDGYLLWPLTPNIDTVRFLDDQIYIPEDLTLPFVDRMVLANVPPFLDPRWSMNKLVVNHRQYSGIGWDRIDHTSLPATKKIVYIFDAESLQQDKASGSIQEGLVIATFYRLGKILHAAAAYSIPVTVVGAEALDLSEERPPDQPELRGDAIIEFLKTTVLDPATYMSREAYRDSIGETEFAIETDFTTELLTGPPIFYLKTLPAREKSSWCVVQ